MAKEDIKILRRRLNKARNNEKLLEVSEYCCSLAACLSEIEEYEEALSLYKESLKACESLEYKEGITLANRMIAETCINLGYFDEALRHVNVFLKYALNDNNKVEEQRGLVLKGHVFFTQAEYLLDVKPAESENVEKLLEQSMEAYRRSFAICVTELKDINEKERLQMKARLLQNKSLVLIRQNKLQHAQNHLIRAVRICAKEKFKDTECMCYLSLGDLYIRKEEYENALSMFDKAFELSTTAQRKTDSLIAKAKTCILMENYERAKTILKKAHQMKTNDEVKKILKQILSITKLQESLCSLSDHDTNQRKELYKKLGKLYCALKVYKKGIKNYLNMLGCCQKTDSNQNELIKCYRLLYEALTKDKQYNKALFYCNQEAEALLKNVPEEACKTYFKIAKLHELNGSDFEEIYFAYVKAKTKADEFNNKKLKLMSLRSIIKLGKKFNKIEIVEKSVKELTDLQNEDSNSSCESESNSELEATDSDRSSESSGTDIDLQEMLANSDIESKESGRLRERCKRTKFGLKKNEKGETELHVAAIKGNYRKVKLLIDQGHPVNVRDTAGWTPLHEACNHGYVDIVNILLDFGADINDKGGPCCDGITPLHDAAINGQLEVVDVLIKRGASVLVLNDFGETPLQCLVSWRKKSALDKEEENMFKNIVNALKSPLDSSTMKENQNISESTNEKKRDPAFKKNSSFCILNNKEKNLQNPCTKKITESRGNKEFSRRKRQVIGSSDEGSQSENSDGSSDNSTNSKSSLACNMYKKAIKDLRHKPKKFKFIDFEKEKSRPALVDEKNYVDNCIIDSDAADDEGEENEEVNEYKGEEKNKIEKEERVGVGYEFSKNNEEIYKEFVDLEEECVEQLMRELESSPMKIFNEKHSTSETELESKPWLKAIPSDLLKSDFKEHSYQEQQIDDGQVLMSESRKPDTKNLSLSPSVDCNSSSPILWNAADKGSGAVDLTVQICNNEIKIPVKKIELTELKIDWLVGEVAKQYPIVESPDYCVTLRTKSNITISESDLLTTVVDETIEFVVTKWKMLPLNERYEKVCLKRNHADIGTELGSYTSFKHSIQPQVAQILKCSPSRRYTLSNLKLSSLSLAPICKAMKYESFIQVLNLSNNYFGDKGIELIVKIFDKCIIEELNLSGCSITSSGVYLFSDSLSKINDLSKNGLQVLNLSKNPITDDAVEAINNIMEQLPNLTVLNLDHCELETLISTKVFTNLIVTQGNNTVNTQTNLDIATTNS